MELLIWPMLPFLAAAPLTLLPVALFLWLLFARVWGSLASLPVAIAAFAWCLYAAWEISFMLRPVREWIRVDLLLISPVLIVCTLWALIASRRHWRRSKDVSDA